jgi:hypothetical protein
MTKDNQKLYELIAESIWRSGFLEDKNKIRQAAKEQMRDLIATDIAASLKNTDPNFDKDAFMNACNV